MRARRNGFTLVEVALFLALTGVLFAGIVAGVQNSMFQQKYNDSVQSFAEFLRGAYAKTMNVEHIGDGRSGQAVYGKMIVFGESCDLSGECAGVDTPNGDVYIYDVVGKIGNIGGGADVLGALHRLQASVFAAEASGSGAVLQLAGIPESYTPRWGSRIQGVSSDTTDFRGAILIVRHPQTGNVYTYAKNGTIEINESVAGGGLSGVYSNLADAEGGANNFMNNNVFNNPSAWSDRDPVNFCVNPNGNERSAVRRNVRIVANARNASGVEVVDADSSENECER